MSMSPKDPVSAHRPSPGGDTRSRELEAVNAAARKINERTRVARENGNALTEMEALSALGTEFAEDGAIQHMLAYKIAHLHSHLGNYADAIRVYDRVLPAAATLANAATALQGFAPESALRILAEVADTAQVMMINEAHHIPQHRAFTLRLLELLRQKGFTFFAAETLYETDTGLNERGYPTVKTGAYIAEPVYGDLVRNALRQGYRVVAYEASGNADLREHGQATNLARRILETDPGAKILVHAGFAHINQSGTLAGARPMAAQFEEITGIDPYTVNQTTMTEHSGPEYEHPVYLQAEAHGWLEEPMIFTRDGEVWSAAPGKNDATLFHPRTQQLGGRPTWLRLGGSRFEYRLGSELCGKGRHCLVRAMAVGESPDAVPVDQVEVVPGVPLPVLLLPQGDFEIQVEDAGGAAVGRVRAQVVAKSPHRR